MSYRYEMQNAIYQYIKSYIAEYEHAPSMREIAAVHGLKSASTVQFHLKNLERQGKIQLIGKPASISIPAEGPEEAHEDDASAGRAPLIPMYSGQITPKEPFGSHVGHVPFSTLEPLNKCFAFRMSGEAMILDGIYPDDIIIVSTSADTPNRSRVAIAYNNRLSVRTLQKSSTSCKLTPSSADYTIIDGSSCSILGKVIGVIRRY